MKWIIDRIVPPCVVLESEDGILVEAPSLLLPQDAKEGDILVIETDKKAAQDRKLKIEKLMKDVWADD
jgi:hypothetical protein